MPAPELPNWESINSLLSGIESGDIVARYRALFAVRQKAADEGQAIGTLVDALRCPQLPRSVLFRHECCYVLGQAGADTADLKLKKVAFAALLDVLIDAECEDEVTRHEAAEGIAAVFNNNMPDTTETESFLLERCLEVERQAVAVGDVSREKQNAIESSSTVTTASTESDPSNNAANQAATGAESSDATPLPQRRNAILIRILSKFSDEITPLGQTCFLAIEGLKRDTARMCACQYASYDPAIGVEGATENDVPHYAALLRDPSAPFFERYVAMFTLRNLGAGQELARCLREDKSSPVLRHEIGFVLGQLESEAAAAALIENLSDIGEHVMVRHESAIALGSVGSPDALAALQKFSHDPEPMVAESCLVGLATAAYWAAWEAEEERIKNS